MTNCEVSLWEPHDAAVLTVMVKIHHLHSSSFEEVPATCKHLPTRPSHWDKQIVYISLHFRELNVTIFSSATPTTTQVSDAASWLRRLVAGLTFRRPGFNPRLSLWDLWRTEWHWDRFSSYYCSCLLSVSFHQRPVLIHSFIIDAV
jgi:hypothetical protein